MGRLAALALVAGLFLAAGEAAPAAQKTTAARPGKAPSGPYDSAVSCKRCHAAIHANWSESAHARAATTPSFLRSMEETMKLSSDPARTRKDCVECHAPTTRLTGDLDLKNPVSAEGVTCDFCHTVKEVSLEHAGQPFTLDPGPVKRGPFAYSRPFPGHRAEYSFLHRGSPLLCAACHEFANEKGFPLLVTYSGWKEGPFPARGIACQDCHMTLIPGKVANDDLAQKQGPRVINRHRLVGGSSMSQLNRGVRLKIESFSATGTVAEVRVAVANEGAGHPIPGGLPTKALVLVLGAENASGALENTQETIYRREILDAQGAPLKTLPEMVVRGWKVGQDSRLKPGETRHESFRVNLKGGSRAVVARLEYRDGTDTGAPATSRIITQERRELKSR